MITGYRVEAGAVWSGMGLTQVVFLETETNIA
jgi:hypothetical protein